uniref:Uncharacterized protein n=1 Tax=Cacopsylla melanoneura TaxID=428564 RepID=A0A8D8TPY5_9HEMI
MYHPYGTLLTYGVLSRTGAFNVLQTLASTSIPKLSTQIVILKINSLTPMGLITPISITYNVLYNLHYPTCQLSPSNFPPKLISLPPQLISLFSMFLQTSVYFTLFSLSLSHVYTTWCTKP